MRRAEIGKMRTHHLQPSTQVFWVPPLQGGHRVILHLDDACTASSKNPGRKELSRAWAPALGSQTVGTHDADATRTRGSGAAIAVARFDVCAGL